MMACMGMMTLAESIHMSMNILKRNMNMTTCQISTTVMDMKKSKQRYLSNSSIEHPISNNE